MTQFEIFSVSVGIIVWNLFSFQHIFCLFSRSNGLTNRKKRDDLDSDEKHKHFKDFKHILSSGKLKVLWWFAVM